MQCNDCGSTITEADTFCPMCSKDNSILKLCQRSNSLNKMEIYLDHKIYEQNMLFPTNNIKTGRPVTS